MASDGGSRPTPSQEEAHDALPGVDPSLAHGRLVRRPASGAHCSFLRVLVPYRTGRVGDVAGFQRLLSTIEDGWRPGDLRRVGLEPHVERHIRAQGTGAGPNVSAALYEPIVREWERSTWTMGTAKNLEPGIPFEVCRVALLVSLLGASYLTIEIAPEGDDAGDLLDLAHRLRLLGDRSPLLGRGREEPVTLASFADELMHTAIGQVPDKLVTGVGFPSYVGAFVDATDLDAEARAAFRQRLRRQFHRSQPVTPDDLVTDVRDDDVTYRRDQWLFHSLEGGGFLAFDPAADEFSRNVMVDHLKRAYFFGFEFALLQRHALLTMSASVADDWMAGESPADRARSFRALREQLLLFTARFRFTQIMVSQNRHRDYRRWLEVLEVEALHDEVRTEVGDMHAYLEEARQESAEREREEEAQRREVERTRVEQRDRLIGLVAAVFIVPSLVIGFLGINLDGVTTGRGLGILQAGGIAVVSAAVGVAIAALGVRPPRR